MKRIGLMGCGTVANYGHIPTLLETGGLELASLFDPNEDNLKSTAEKFGIENAFTDLDAFMQSGIDAVSITSPLPYHHANVVDAARYQKHILCEKPLAMDEEECRDIIRITEEAGVMLFTGFDYRFSPAALKMRELVRAGAIGKLLNLRLIYIWNCHGKYQKNEAGELVENERRKGRMLEGGPLVDCGVHQIDLARFWTESEVRDWTAAGAWVDEYETPDHTWLHMNHENGAHSMVEISYSYCHTTKDPINLFTYELIGTKGMLRYDRGAKLFELRNDEGTQTLEFSPEKNFAGMYEAFAAALATGSSDTLPTALDGLMAAKLSREAVDYLVSQHQ